MRDKFACEFNSFDMAAGWRTPAGFPPGVDEKILGGSLDETARQGVRTRLVRFAPGTSTTQTLVHDYWEEVLLVSGDLDIARGEPALFSSFEALNYACRPPGTLHGPFRSQSGCIVLEIHYFDPSEKEHGR
jgi:hypothetical protein